MVKNRKGLVGVEGGKGICYKWKEKGQCSHGDRCSFHHETQDRAQKPEHTAATPSEPTVSRGRSVSRKGSIRGRSIHRSILRQPFRSRERLVKIGIRPSCNSINMKRVVRLETSVCFHITRLMNNPKKSRKRAISHNEEKAMTRMLWLLWKVCHNWVLYHKIQMHSFLKVESLGEPDAESLGTNSKGTIHEVYATSSEYPGKERAIVGKNKCQSSSSAKSLHHGGLCRVHPGVLKTSTTMTSPSVRRSSMRAEDEPLTLKEKACRLVCRRRQ